MTKSPPFFLLLHSEEIRGEILFVLYRLSVLEDDDGTDTLYTVCPNLLRLSLQVLIKTQMDDVRLNCVGLLSVSFGLSYSILFGVSL